MLLPHLRVLIHAGALDVLLLSPELYVELPLHLPFAARAVNLHLVGLEAEDAGNLLDEQVELGLEVAYLADVLALVLLELLVLLLLQHGNRLHLLY